VTPVDVEKRRKLVRSAVKVVIASNPIEDASPDEMEAYQGHLESVGFEAVMQAEPKWTERRGEKRGFLFAVAKNKATTAAKKYLRQIVRGDEVDDDRTGGDGSSPEQVLALRERVPGVRAWRVALVERLQEIADSKPRYRLALEAFEEKVVTPYGFVAVVADRHGIDESEVERALDAFKKKLQRDEVISRLRATAPERGLLDALDNAQEYAASEAAEDSHDDQGADRGHPAGAGAGPGLAQAAGAADAAGVLARDDAGAGGTGAGAAPGQGGGGVARPLTTWLTFPAGRPACRARLSRDPGRSEKAPALSRCCGTPQLSGFDSRGSNQGRRRPPKPVAAIGASRTTGTAHLTALWPPWCPPARAAPGLPAPS
jgi:hypothetical protein